MDGLNITLTFQQLCEAAEQQHIDLDDLLKRAGAHLTHGVMMPRWDTPDEEILDQLVKDEMEFPD